MLERDSLKKLGWSDELIDRVSNVAEKMRKPGLPPVPASVASQTISSATVSSSNIASNTGRNIIFQATDIRR